MLTFEQLSTHDSGRSSDGFIEIFSTLKSTHSFFLDLKGSRVLAPCLDHQAAELQRIATLILGTFPRSEDVVDLYESPDSHRTPYRAAKFSLPINALAMA